jgi:hypothetical protein
LGDVVAKKDEPKGTGAADEDREQGVARAEAKEVLERMAKDLRVLDRYVRDERAELDQRALTPRRVARLRLIGEDVASASKLSQRRGKK